MKVSLNWIRDYVDLPEDLTAERLAFDLTMRTVEVESVRNPAEDIEGIVVGRIHSVRAHPRADRLVICMVDIGRDRLSQIVCGGSNLYSDELVAVAPPGAKVRWHGQGDPVELQATKLRGELSEGMICSSEEIYLDDLFPATDENEIVDLTREFPNATPGQPLAELLNLADLIIEIDNKSMTNRPDLWGHYGIARELGAIYGGSLRPLPEFILPDDIRDYPVEIASPERCRRYDALVFEGVEPVQSPFWMKDRLWSVGIRPINLLVDITNFVMLATGQPTHGFDMAHVKDGIRVRTAKDGETLELLDGHVLSLAGTDLLICDGQDKAIGLAGVMGGAHDSILPDTSGMVLEVANFEAIGIRKTATRHQIRTESSIRFEKAIDTERCDQALGLAIALIKELQPEARVTAAGHRHKDKTLPLTLPVSLDFLSVRSGRDLSADDVIARLTPLGFDIEFDGKDTLTVTVPTWRATGDIDIKDDILEEVCRMIGYDQFDFVPPRITLDKAARQLDFESERAIREYLAFRVGLQEIFTYPWVADRYLEAAGEDLTTLLTLATPPAPDHARLRGSLVPGLLEAVTENARYYDEFGLFELAQVYSKGESRPSVPDETLPVQERRLGIALAGDLPFLLFRRLKGILTNLPRFGRVADWTFQKGEMKMPWADRNAWLDLVNDKEQTVGRMGLLSPKATVASGIRQLFVVVAEIEVDRLTPLPSRDNRFTHLPQFPNVEQDLSIVVDDHVSWLDIEQAIGSHVRRSEFVEEYRGSQVPEGMKSLMFRFWLASDDGTLSAEEIEQLRSRLIKRLKDKLGAGLR
ncbi:MAG TPA: phenylalanine--tRNA ligase subunit beta [Clostridia bacterium]|nr:phenylalanine--tRNA ligase subunit beta [Clostridia bacterium]